MKKLLILALVLSLAACGKNATIVGPVIDPSPSPTPAPNRILVSISIKAQGGGSATSSFPAGQEMILQGSVDSFDSTGKAVTPPPVASWAWSNFSDVQAHCQVFGEDNSSHPHAKCDGQGTFVVQATALDFDGKDLGISPVFSAVVF